MHSPSHTENGGPEFVLTVGELRARIICKGVGSALAARFCPVAHSHYPVEWRWIEKLPARVEQIRSEFASNIEQRPARQLAYHDAILAVLRECWPVVQEVFASRSLRARIAATLELGPLLPDYFVRFLRDSLAQVGVRAYHYLQENAREFSVFEDYLRWPGIFTPLLQPQEVEPQLVLEIVYQKPRRAFADYLRDARLKAGLTQEQLAWRVGLPQVRVSSWERGQVPSRWLEDDVDQIDKALDCGGQLRGAYEVSRAATDQLKPRSVWGDVVYADLVSQRVHEATGKWIAYCEKHEIGSRGGCKNASGPLAEKTRRIYCAQVYRDLAFASFASDHQDVRRRGLGWDPATIGFLDLTNIKVRELSLQLSLLRSDREDLQASDRNWLNRLAKTVKPETGYIWRNAAELAAAEPYALARCPTHFGPHGVCPGAKCATDVQRVWAACYVAHEWCERMAKAASRGTLSPKHLKELAGLLRDFPQPLDALMTVLTRLEIPERIPTSLEEARIQQFAAVLAIMMLYPYRPEDLTFFKRDAACIDASDNVRLHLPPPRKNRRGFFARDPICATAPEELAIYIRPYLRWGRPYLAALSGVDLNRLLIHSKGIAAYCYMNNLFFNYLRPHYADVFPATLPPHKIRHIVATDACVRYGYVHGERIATKHVRDGAVTIKYNYVVALGLKAYTECEGDVSHERSIRDSFRTVTGGAIVGAGLASIRAAANAVFCGRRAKVA